jgi:hypothetical protein
VLTDAGAVIMRLVPPERAVKKGDSPDAVGQGRRLVVEWLAAWAGAVAAGIVLEALVATHVGFDFRPRLIPVRAW